MNTNVYIHNDVRTVTAGDLHTFTHNRSRFPEFTLHRNDAISCVRELYTTTQHGLRVVLHLRYLGYLVVSPSGVVMARSLASFDDAVRRADELDRDYARCLVLHTFKGLPKARFVKEVRQGGLQARLVYTALNGRDLDEDFFPLVKRSGVGSIDICRGGGAYSGILYISSFSAALMAYTGTELLVYDAAYRLYNDHELSVLARWESMRDIQAEMLDALTDGSSAKRISLLRTAFLICLTALIAGWYVTLRCAVSSVCVMISVKFE